MIYVVTTQQQLFNSTAYKTIGVEESLALLTPLSTVGVDTETSGLNCHDDTLLTVQLGCYDFQVVIDCSTIDIRLYKEFLESDRLFLFWNAKFDLKWLYRYGIVPRRVYDGFLTEKVLWLGYPVVLSPEMWDKIKEPRYDYIPENPKKKTKARYILQMNLKKAGELYLGVELDKSIRGQIIYKGLSSEDVVVYAALDVKYLEKIKEKQEELIREGGYSTAIDYINRFILPLAYMEFCGIKLDVNKWKRKMAKDEERLNECKISLNNWLIENMPESPYIYIERQGDLFTGFDLTPKVTINWNSAKQVIPIFKQQGISVKHPKEDKDSIDAKILAPQKDKSTLIPLYIRYKEMEKLCSTYGNNFIDQINKNTRRLYTNYNPLGTDTCRISSGGKDKANKIEYVNMLNLPSDSETRACFIAEKGNKWISIDYSGQESFIMADMANDTAMINELMYGEKDLHTLTAKLVFPQIPKDMPVEEVREKFHDERQQAKGYEFAFNYAGNASTIQRNFGLTEARANEIYNSYMSGFNGLKRYIDNRKKDWWKRGYIELNPLVGFKTHIYNYKYLKATQESFSEPGFWEYYREMKESDPESYTVQKVREFFKNRADLDRASVNYPIQHTGALCYMVSMVNFFEYLRDKGLLFKVLITVTPYDEINCEAPEEIAEEIADALHSIMVKAGAFFVHKCKLDAEISRNKEDGSLPDCWVH